MRRLWVVLVGAAALASGCGSGSGGPAPSATPSQSEASPPAVACPAGSSPDRPGDPTRARPALPDPTLLAAMDPTGPRIIVGETGFVPEGAGTTTLQSVWAFDVCTNGWTELGDASLPAAEQRPALSQLVADPQAGVVRGIPIRWTPVWTFDPTADSWRVSAASPGDRQAVPTAVYDTDAGRLLAFDPTALAGDPDASGILAYDPATEAWAGLELADPGQGTPVGAISPSYDYDVAYDSAARRLVLVLTPLGRDAAPATWVFDPAEPAWTQGADMPDALAGGYAPTGWAAGFDPGTGRTWWFADTAMLGYDARADAWVVAQHGAGWPEPIALGGAEVDPTARIVSTMVPDPVNGRLVVIGGRVRPIGDPVGGSITEGDLLATDDVWAYQPATNTWTMLLAPSASPASYGPG